MEVWDAYDQNRTKLEGVRLDRSAFPYKEGYYHLAVNAWVQDQDGAWLFMKRSSDKEHYPNVYELGAGGSVLKGENSWQAAQREVQEETGLVPSELEFLFSFTQREYLTHFDTFLVKLDQKEPAVAYQEGETDDHIWVNDEELEDFFSNHLVFENQKKQLLTYCQEKSQ